MLVVLTLTWAVSLLGLVVTVAQLGGLPANAGLAGFLIEGHVIEMAILTTVSGGAAALLQEARAIRKRLDEAAVMTSEARK